LKILHEIKKTDANNTFFDVFQKISTKNNAKNLHNILFKRRKTNFKPLFYLSKNQNKVKID